MIVHLWGNFTSFLSNAFYSIQLLITAGEDCTCRVWGLDGMQLKVIKEHM